MNRMTSTAPTRCHPERSMIQSSVRVEEAKERTVLVRVWSCPSLVTEPLPGWQSTRFRKPEIMPLTYPRFKRVLLTFAVTGWFSHKHVKYNKDYCSQKITNVLRGFSTM